MHDGGRVVYCMYNRVYVLNVEDGIFTEQNAAEISVAKCFLMILTLSILIRVLVNMTKLQILTRSQREFGVAKGAERGM